MNGGITNRWLVRTCSHKARKRSMRNRAGAQTTPNSAKVTAVMSSDTPIDRGSLPYRMVYAGRSRGIERLKQ